MRPPETGRVYLHRADERFAMGSTIKVYAAAALLRLEAEGALRLDETRPDRWEPDLDEAARGDERDTPTAAAPARDFEEVLLGAGLPAAQQRTLTGWMRTTTTSGTRIRAGPPPGRTSADKTGGACSGRWTTPEWCGHRTVVHWCS